jgi:hypothetical protein
MLPDRQQQIANAPTYPLKQIAATRTQAWSDAETLMIFACEQWMTRDRLLAALCEMVFIRLSRQRT